MAILRAASTVALITDKICPNGFYDFWGYDDPGMTSIGGVTYEYGDNIEMHSGFPTDIWAGSASTTAYTLTNANIHIDIADSGWASVERPWSILSASDRIIGSDRSDRVSAYDGNDTVTGGSGNDLLNGGFGADVLIGGDHADKMYGNAGNDRLPGGAGDDGLYGGIGNDSLNGGGGTDRMQGGQGNDVLVGGLGNDEITCGDGADRVKYTSVLDGHDVILDFDGDPTGGQDVLDLNALFDSLGIAASQRAGRVSINDLGNAVDISVNADGKAGFELLVATLNTANEVTKGQDVIVGT